MPWDKVMHKWGSGILRSGNKETGPVVHNQKQAIAIMLSEKKKAQGNPEYQSSIRHPGALGRAKKRAIQ